MAEEKEEKEKEQENGSATLEDVFDESVVTGEDRDRPRRKRKLMVDLKCPLCESGVKYLTYKDVYQLKKFTSVRGKVIGSDKSGVCTKHQRQLSRAIKNARYMALLPYVSLTK